MSDVLKEFIKNNSAGFKEIPPTDLWNKIESNLLKTKKTETMIKYGFGASVIIAGTFLIINLQKENVSSPKVKSEVIINSSSTSPQTIEGMTATNTTVKNKKITKIFNVPVKENSFKKTDTALEKNEVPVATYEKQEDTKKNVTEAMDIADWHSAGSKKNSYEMFIDKVTGEEKSSATIRSVDKKIDGFGTLMQSTLHDKYLGKRIRMTGYVKTQDVTEWAGLWLRIGVTGGDEALGFDNMRFGVKDRSIKGTTERTKYEIVLDVPENSANILYGAMLVGTGQIWFDEIEFEIVDNSVPVTGGDPANFKFLGKERFKSYHPTDFWRWYVPGRVFSKDGTSNIGK